MRAKLASIFVLIILTCVLFLNQPYTKAQSNPNVINVPLTFHPNSLVINDANGSLQVYEGVDGLAATGSNPTQVTLSSQISGQQIVFGMPIDYWSASIIWGMRVPKDMHVYGTVNIRAYISSNFAISGFTSGSGYGMGLVDIDENNNPVQQFITQGPIAIGGNAFTSTPQQYSLSTNIDYVFKAGHAIGFSVGFGATTKGYTATIYFNSADKPSGATLPIVDTSTSYDFTADTKNIKIQSNSAIADYNYNSLKQTLQFTAKLIDYTTGYCNITIPKTLMQSPFTITSGPQQITTTISETQTNYNLYFTHTRTSNPIQVTGNAINTQSPTPNISPTPSGSNTIPSPTPTSTSSGSTTMPSSQGTTNPTNEPKPSVPEISSMAIIALIAGTTFFLVIYKKKHPLGKR